MSRTTSWRTDEPCPVCKTGLTALDDGGPTLTFECRLCGWSHAGQADAPGGDK